jgi:hypothetical protein
VPARLFRRIQSLFSRLNKTVLLTAVVFVIVGSIVGTAIVTAAPNPAISQDYATYLTLFDGPSTGLSIPSGGFLLQDATAKTVKGFSININLSFNSTDVDSINARWDHVKDDSGTIVVHPFTNDTFVIRVCDTLDQTHCWLNTVPYNKNLTQEDASQGGDILITKNSQSSKVLRNPIQINNYPILTVSPVNNEQNGVQYSYTRTIDTNKDEGVVSDFPTSGVKFPTPSSLEATLWYCADDTGNSGEGKGSKAYDTVGNNTDTIATFGKLCGGNSYFRIGNPLSLSVPATADAAAAQVNKQQAVSGGGVVKSNLPECGIGIIGSSGTINGCAARIAYGIYYLTEWVAALFGHLFDFFIGYSVSDSSYRYSFAVTGWKLVRDISNIFFIIIMIWTGFSAVFDTTNTSMKKVVPALIVNALLINFSLFATRVVIDISNITARMFYSQMVVCEEINKDSSGKCLPDKIKTGTGGYWPLSEAIVGAFNPQKIFQASVLQQSTTVSGDTANSLNTQDVTKNSTPLSATDSANYFAVICLVGAFIMIIISIMFFKVMFLFLGRVVGLYICMIFSPFAFLSREIPMLGTIEKLRWSDWKEDLIKYALLAPIFIFFLYIIYILLSSKFTQDIGSTLLSPDPTNVFELVISTLIPLGIIYALMESAQKIAEKYAGSIGKSIQGFGEKITGFATGAALGVATGGTALAGRNIVGRLGSRIAESETLKNASASGKWYSKLADSTIGTGSALSKSTFDARNTKAVKNLQSKSGLNFDNSLVRLTGTGINKTDGGFKGAISRNEKDLNDRAERFQLKGIAAKNQDDKAKSWETVYQTARTTAEQNALQQGNAFDEVQYRANYASAQTAAGNTKPKDSEEINRDREKQYQTALKKGTILSQISKVVTNRFTAPAGAVGAPTAIEAGASGALGTALAGAGAVAAAAVIGQGAIQGAARENVTLARSSKAKDPVNPQQRQKAETRLNQLQQELLKTVQRLDVIGQSLQPPKRYVDMSNADIIDYRNTRQATLQQIQQQITTNDNFIKANQADSDPAMKARVAAARNRMVTDKAQEQQLNNDIRESRTIWGEYSKVQADISTTRAELKI